MKRMLVIGIILFVAAFPLSAASTALAGFVGLAGIVLIVVSLVKRSSAKRKDRQASKKAAPVTAPEAASTPSSPENAKESIERIHVRGVDNYTENIISVASANPAYDLTKKELAEEYFEERVWQYEFDPQGALVPEPDNQYDPNAIMVQAEGLCIGYVPKGSTSHVRKLMESGRIKWIDLKIGGGKYKYVYEDEDGNYQLEMGENHYSAVVELHLTEA